MTPYLQGNAAFGVPELAAPQNVCATHFGDVGVFLSSKCPEMKQQFCWPCPAVSEGLARRVPHGVGFSLGQGGYRAAASTPGSSLTRRGVAAIYSPFFSQKAAKCN